jgi:hypothetical protein
VPTASCRILKGWGEGITVFKAKADSILKYLIDSDYDGLGFVAHNGIIRDVILQ